MEKIFVTFVAACKNVIMFENCCVCYCTFKTKFGTFSQNQGYISTENLFKPSNRKDCCGVGLADILESVGIPFNCRENYSDGV